MKVILITDVKGIGERSQIVEVKDGYANNYLIPQGLALRATRGKTREVEQLAKVKMIRADRELAKSRDVSSQIQEHSFVITAKVGTEGKLFGTITSREISEHIKEELGIEVDRKKIQLDEHIKQVGLYEAKLKLHPEDETIIHIKVVAENEAAEAPKDAEAPKAAEAPKDEAAEAPKDEEAPKDGD